MNIQVILRFMAATALILAVSINVEAQNILQRARNAAQSATGNSGSTNNPVENAVSNTVSSASLTPDQRTAIDKLNDESKRTAPKVPELSGDQDRGSNFFAGVPKMSEDDAKAFKAAIEARHAENLEIYAALWEVPGNVAEFVENSHEREVSSQSYKPGVREAMSTQVPANNLLKELTNYKAMITEFRRMVTNEGDVEIKGNFAEGSAETTIKSLVVGLTGLRWMDEKWVFVVSGNTPGTWIITPVDEERYNLQNAKYTNLLWLLNKGEGSLIQYDEYWKASILRSHLGIGQRNSLANQTKLPVPSPKMNDAALTAQMLKLAQEKYPAMGVVKVIIDESAWRPETNALGQIIHRRINTKIIYTRNSNYEMVTLSFIQPYAGGSSYGETQAYGIGTDNTAVDYKP